MIVLRSFSSSCSNFWFIEKTKAEKMCCHCAQIGIRSVCAIFSVPLCHAYFLSGPYHQMQLRRYFFSSSHFKSKLFCLFFVLLPSHLRRGQGGFAPPFLIYENKRAFIKHTISRFASVALDGVLELTCLACHTWWCPIISEVLEPIFGRGWGPLNGLCHFKKFFKGLRSRLGRNVGE